MATFGIPILFALFVWWFSTGIVLLVVGMSRRTLRWTVAGTGVLLAGALWVLVATRDETGTAATYAAFTAAIVAWGFVETLFLTGLVTGPRRTACPPDAKGLRRVGYAIEAILYHELLLLAVGALVVLATWGGENRIAVWTYALLWIMRLSAKLNLFLGVPVLNDGLLPAGVAHIKTYFRRRSANRLFPVAVAATVAALLILARDAVIDQSVGLTLLATLLALALLEHLFMILPFPLEAAWGWGMKSRIAPALVEAGETTAGPPANRTRLVPVHPGVGLLLKSRPRQIGDGA